MFTNGSRYRLGAPLIVGLRVYHWENVARIQERRIRSQHPKIGCFADYVPSGYVKIAIENDHRNSGFSH